MKVLLTTLSLLLFIVSQAQKEIKPDEVKDHIGDSVIVQGKILAVQTSKNAPTTISIGTSNPNQRFTIVIRKEVRNQLHIIPTSKDIGNIVWVAGKIERYKGKPQITIKNPKQIDIIQDSQREVDL